MSTAQRWVAQRSAEAGAGSAGCTDAGVDPLRDELRFVSREVGQRVQHPHPVEVAGSMPSEIDRTEIPETRGLRTVLNTSIDDRPRRSIYRTTTVSSASA
nr:hypothetical protein [Nakamurella antarctica]